MDGLPAERRRLPAVWIVADGTSNAPGEAFDWRAPAQRGELAAGACHSCGALTGLADGAPASAGHILRGCRPFSPPKRPVAVDEAMELTQSQSKAGACWPAHKSTDVCSTHYSHARNDLSYTNPGDVVK